jgi:hypothetical protein
MFMDSLFVCFGSTSGLKSAGHHAQASSSTFAISSVPPSSFEKLFLLPVTRAALFVVFSISVNRLSIAAISSASRRH